jgi:amidase
MLNIAMAGGGPGPGGQQASTIDWFTLLEAQAAAQRAWRGVFETVDFVLFPPAAVPAFPHDQSPLGTRILTVNGQPMPVDSILAYAGMVTFPGLPSTVLPVGAAGHLPVGLQVIGPRFADHDCIAAATAIGKLLHG